MWVVAGGYMTQVGFIPDSDKIFLRCQPGLNGPGSGIRNVIGILGVCMVNGCAVSRTACGCEDLWSFGFAL
jgi:hypothetical protein